MGNCKNALTENHNCVNSDRCSNNKPITRLIVKDDKGEVIERFEANDSQEKPMLMPAVAGGEVKNKGKQGKDVQTNEAGESNVMPPIILAEIGSKGSSMIRTGDDDVLEKMRTCQPETKDEQTEEPMIMPACVGEDKDKNKK